MVLRTSARRRFLRLLLPAAMASLIPAGSSLSAAPQGCADSGGLAVVIAPDGFDVDLHSRLAKLIDETPGPPIEIDGPTPSGMFRLRVQANDQCAGLLEKVRTIQSSAKKAGFAVVLVGNDPSFTAKSEIKHSKSMKALAVGTKRFDDFGPEFELLGIQDAWRRTTGKPSITIAILDSGLQLDHPLLKDNIWHNITERKGTANIDDDENGVVDDLDGANFAVESGPGIAYRNTDEEILRHGNDSAYIAAGMKSCSERCSGVAHDCTIMAVKFHKGATAQDFDLARAIEYAAISGASIANLSVAVPVPPFATKRAIDFAASKDMLIVVAAGDVTGDLQTQQHFPAAFSLEPAALPNQMVVMSARNDFSLWQTFSATGVHIAAPFKGRVPGDINGAPDDASGSSISAPFVAGVAALVKSLNPGWWTYSRLKLHLIESGTHHTELVGKNICGKRVHAAQAVLGPMSIKDWSADLVWNASENPRIEWSMTYVSAACQEIVVEFKPENSISLETIATGTAQALGLAVDVTQLSGKRGHVRVRSLGSNFRTDWMPVTIS